MDSMKTIPLYVYSYIGCIKARRTQYTHILLSVILNKTPFSWLPIEFLFWIMGWLCTLFTKTHLLVLTIHTYLLACQRLGRHLGRQTFLLRAPQMSRSLIGTVISPLIPYVIYDIYALSSAHALHLILTHLLSLIKVISCNAYLFCLGVRSFWRTLPNAVMACGCLNYLKTSETAISLNCLITCFALICVNIPCTDVLQQ